MDTFKLQTRISQDGLLKLELPTGLAEQEVEVILVLQPLQSTNSTHLVAVDELGWPLGFFERTFGSMPDLERPPQLQLEDREPLE